MTETENKVQDQEPEQQDVENQNQVEENDTQQDEIKQLQEKYDQLNDKLLRTLAEYDNYRKRTQKEKDAIYPQAKSDTVEKFLPIIDNFERAMQCECTDTEFKKGIDMIFKSFMEIFDALSVEVIGEEGEQFDPSKHSAVMHVEDEQYDENTVIQVLQKGYKIGDKVVRYAMVKVAN